MKLVIQAAGKTDVGLVRANNEDNFGYDLGHGIFVVCDGMGGQAAGEMASKIAVETVLKCFAQDHDANDSHVLGPGFQKVSERANALGNAVQLANRAIQEAAARNPEQSGMGSTIVAVSTGDTQFSIANVGDSRIYLIRAEAIQQLTNDHSLVMEQVRRGLMTIEEAEQSEMQNVIVRALGTEETVEPDLGDHEFVPGDLLMLCSDGLSRYIKENIMLEMIRSTEDLDKACSKLIEAAKAAGSDDNITCLLLRARERDQSWADRLRNLISPANNSRHSSG
jgi:serine/threonine protein phosphatase PrpC